MRYYRKDSIAWTRRSRICRLGAIEGTLKWCHRIGYQFRGTQAPIHEDWKMSLW